MSYNFAGKRALVTGAGKGIGCATAKFLAKCGADVIALSRTQADLDSLKKEVNTITTICVDLADLDATKKAVESLGPIHLLVNNAGVAVLQHFLDVTPETYDRIMDVNLKAVLFVSQYVAKGMVERGDGGAIVNVSSQASQCALKQHAVYCASKGGLDMLTKVMGLELAPFKMTTSLPDLPCLKVLQATKAALIRVNAVNPTVVMTEMGRLAWSDPKVAGPMLSRIPLGKFAEEEDVVNAIAFLLSDQSAMINCVTLPVDGGFLAC